MDALRGWAVTLCFAAVAAGMAGIIAPHGNLEKVYRFVVSLFFLACVLTPIFSMRGVKLQWPAAADASVSAVYPAQSVAASQQTQAARQRLASLAAACVRQQGAEPLAVAVTLQTQQDGAITGAQIQVTVAAVSESKRQALEKALREQLGLTVPVVSGEE